jgi:hypothetical protein
MPSHILSSLLLVSSQSKTRQTPHKTTSKARQDKPILSENKETRQNKQEIRPTSKSQDKTRQDKDKTTTRQSQGNRKMMHRKITKKAKT